MNTSVSKNSKAFAPALSYKYKNALYLNITSRCPTACEFCIKFSWDYQYRGYNLLLKNEPSVREILDACPEPGKYSEIVFCGYGESTYRLKEMIQIARSLKENGAKKIRLNTIGLGNLIQGRNIVPDLARVLDSVSVSLNTADPDQWVRTLHPLPEFKARGFESVLAFIRESAGRVPETYVSAVDTIVQDPAAFQTFVESLGAKVKIRPYLDEYEDESSRA